MAFFLTRINVVDYDAWKPKRRLGRTGSEARFPGGHRIFLLNRFADRTELVIVAEEEAVGY